MSRKILLVRLGSLGDIVHTLPVLATLRESFPEAQIDWVVEQQWQELIELHPGLSNVIPVDTLGWRRGFWRGGAAREMRSVVHTLRHAQYDVALDLQGLYKSSLLAALSGAVRRVGFDVHSLKEPGASVFYTEQIPALPAMHVVEKNLALAAEVGAAPPNLRFDLPTTPEDEGVVDGNLKKLGVERFFVINPGGGWGSKLWPVERYAELCDRLVGERGWRCFLNAGPGEESLLAGFRDRVRTAAPVNFPVTLRQLVALLRRAELLICGDTGPLHLAAALGTPVVALFGPTDPARNGPCAKHPNCAAVVHHKELGILTYRHESAPSPAILAITVDEVKAAADRVLEAARG